MTMFMLENVAIVVWFQQHSAASIDRLDRRIAKLRADRGTPMTMVHLVKLRLQVPDDASRTAMLQLMTKHDVTLMAVVMAGGGFAVSMLRSAITGLRVLTGGRTRRARTCSSRTCSRPSSHRSRARRRSRRWSGRTPRFERRR